MHCRAPWCRNHKHCLTARGTSSCIPSKSVSRKSWHCWAVSLSAYRGPWQCSPIISVQMLMPKQAWYPHSWIAQELSCAQRWLLWMVNIASCVKYASSVHRMLCKNCSSTVCWCRSHLQNCIHRGQLSGNRCALHEHNSSLWSTAMTMSE
jgi:hypothetical protein